MGPGFEHLAAILEYFLLVFPSRFLPVAVLLSVCAAVGTVVLLRESRELALIVLSFPVLYVLFFSAFPVMIVRNLLVVGPFLAVLTARGAAVLVRRARPGWLGAGVAGLLTLGLLANGWWLVHAAESIRASDKASALRGLAAYLGERPGARFRLSQRVRDGLRVTGAPVLADATREEADRMIFFTSEAGRQAWDLPARRGLSMAWFGPFEVNFDYYPTWQGRDRIVVIGSSTAAGLDVSWAEPEPR